MFKRQSIQLIRKSFYATESTASSTILPHSVEQPPKYVLSTLRSFPSLEPHSVLPVSNEFLNAPLRRDILWRALVKEADCARVGASNPPGRGEHRFSGRKLMAQKGNGRARVGDANSPIRINGARALARTAPNDFSTDLPLKLYANAFRVALSELYRQGNLFIIGQESSSTTSVEEKKNEFKDFQIPTSDYHSIDFFINAHGLKNLNLLFVASDINKVENLAALIRHYPSKRLTLADPEELEVRDILKANRVYIEKEALERLANKYVEDQI